MRQINQPHSRVAAILQTTVNSSYRRRIACTLLAGLLTSVGACNTAPKTNAPAHTIAHSRNAIASAPESSSADAREQRSPFVMPATSPVVRAVPAPKVHSMTADPSDGFQLNFSDTDIAVVIASVLGDGLGLAYAIDPQVKGTMSLQATRPLSRAQLIPALEAALRLQGLALIDVDGGYNVVPLKEAYRQVPGLRSSGQHPSGYGIQIVPLEYVSATDMEKTLRPLAAEGAILHVDESRNLLILAGTSRELEVLLNAVQIFDVDWLSGMSFALYPLAYADARAISDELGQIFTDQKSPIANLVRIVPLSRLNALLVVTRQAEYLRKVEI